MDPNEYLKTSNDVKISFYASESMKSPIFIIFFQPTIQNFFGNFFF